LWPYFYPASTDDPIDPGVYLNTAAAGLFVVNALLCFLDWYMQREQLSVMNMIVDENITGGFQLQSISTKITWYYFFNNIFFLAAALVFLIQAFWWENSALDIYHCSVGFCGSFWINFWGNFLYVLSSIFSFLEYREDMLIREKQGLPPMTLLPYSWESFDWFGWGDILYVATSVIQSAQSFFMFFPTVTDDFNDGYYLVANIFFLVDSLAYFIGYIVFLFEMRQALLCGKVPVQQTGAIRDMLGDTVQLCESSSPSSFLEVGPEDTLYPNSRRAEHGYVSIDEIRDKLMTAREIRSHRASDPLGRMLISPSKISSLQSTLAQRKSETNFSRMSTGSSVDNILLWGMKGKNVSKRDEDDDEHLTSSLLGNTEKNL
jgi:hypothetical protein